MIVLHGFGTVSGGGASPSALVRAVSTSGALTTDSPFSATRPTSRVQSYTLQGYSGKRLKVTLTTTFDGWLILRNPSGTIVVDQDSETIGYTPTVTGTFTLEVTTYSGGVTGSFSLLWNREANDDEVGTMSLPYQLVTGQSYANDDFLNPTAANFRGDICDTWKITTGADSRRVQFRAKPQDGSTYPNHFLLDAAKSAAVLGINGVDNDNTPRVTLAANTTYYYISTPYYAGTRKNYDVHFRAVPLDSEIQLIGATTLTGQSLDEGILPPTTFGGDTEIGLCKIYKFTGSGAITVTLSNLSPSSWDSAIFILDSSKTILKFEDSLVCNYTLPSSGTYFIHLQEFHANDFQMASFNMQLAGAGITS